MAAISSRTNEKPGTCVPGSIVYDSGEDYLVSLGRKGRELRLEGLVGFLGGREVKLADLVHLAEERLIGFLGIALLDFERLVERLGGGGLLEGFGARSKDLREKSTVSAVIVWKPLVTAVAEAT